MAAQYVATFLKPEMWHLYRQICALRAFRPVVLCQKRQNPTQFPFEEVVRVPKPALHQWRRFWQRTVRGRPITAYHSEVRRLQQALTAHRAQLLHIYFGHIAVYLLPWLERLTIPAIVSFHGADAQVDHDDRVYVELSRRALAKARLVLVRSQSIAERLSQLGCEPSKIRLHRTGLPLGDWEYSPRTPPADGAWHVVQACRLIPKKGLSTTLRAFAAFARSYPHSHLTLAGGGPLLEPLRALAGELDLSRRVSFPGFLPQADLRALYRQAHLFLHPSELGPDGDQEGVPNSMLEAMATGLPVLATHHGGIPEAVEHGRSGLLVAEGDAPALAAEMTALVSEPTRWAAIGREAAHRVVERFDLNTQTRLLETFYTETLT